MSKRNMIIVGVLLGVAAVGLIVWSALKPPETSHPAFAVAVDFTNAAATGDDETAMALLSPELQAYVAENCPDERVSGCVMNYTPPEWGGLLKGVFRRSVPEGTTIWHVDVIATYELEKGFSGVCIYNRVEQDAAGEWKVTEWAGFLHCGDPASRNMATNANTPNRAP